MNTHSITWTPAPEHSQATEVIHRLRMAYGEPTRIAKVEPIDELIATILSQNTSDVNTDRSYSELRRRFPDWEGVLAATDNEVADAIRSGGLADIKAPRIRRLLAEIRERIGSFDLKFLGHMPLRDAKDWLTSLPGVGPKTAACVLLFSLDLPALPVDTHVHRVALRLGFVPAGTSADQAHELLEPQFASEDMLAAHLLLIQHGRRACQARRPRCLECALFDLCPSARSFVQVERISA